MSRFLVSSFRSRSRERAFAEIFGHVGGRGAGAAVAEDVDELFLLPGLEDQIGHRTHFLRIDAVDFLVQAGNVGSDVERGAEHEWVLRKQLNRVGQTLILAGHGRPSQPPEVDMATPLSVGNYRQARACRSLELASMH